MNPSEPANAQIRSYATSLVFGLILFAVAFSLFFNGNHYYFYAISITAAMLAAAVTVCTHTGQPCPVGLPGSIFGIFVAWSALAITWSFVPYVSVRELGSLGAGFFLYLTLALHPDRRLLTVTGEFLAALGLGLAGAMLLQSIFGFEPRAMFVNPNSAAGYINLLWPISATAWIVSGISRYRRIAALCAVAVIFAAIGLTGSRGAIIASLIALTIISVAGILLLREPRRVGVLVAVVLVALTVANILGGGQIGAGAGSMADPGSAGASRFTIWAAAWEMIREHPVLGYGPGVFALAYPAFRRPSDGSAGYFVHNDYLEFWLERGLPGLLLVLLLAIACVVVFRRAWKAESTGNHPTSQFPVTLTAFTGLSTLFVHGLFSYSLQMMPFLLVLAVMIARLETGKPSMLRIALPAVRGKPLRVIALSGISLIGAWQVASHALYFERVDAGIESERRTKYVDAADEFSRARALWSLPDAAWYLQANVHYQALKADSEIARTTRQDLASQAIDFLEAAERRNPLQPAIPLIRGLFHANLPDIAPGSAKNEFRNALRLDPRTVGARYALSQILEREGRTEEAIKLIEEGLRMRYQNLALSRALSNRLDELHDRTDGEDREQEIREPEIESPSYEPGIR